MFLIEWVYELVGGILNLGWDIVTALFGWLPFF